MNKRELHEEALLLAETVSPYMLAVRVLEQEAELKKTAEVACCGDCNNE